MDHCAVDHGSVDDRHARAGRYLLDSADVAGLLRDVRELDGPERDLLEAEEERDRALAALKELEADHRAGRLSDDDYRSVVGPLRQEAAQALRMLDRLAAGTRDGEAKAD